MRICIVGGGIIGLTTALVCLQHGYDVVLLERQSQVGSETSFANGAQLSYAYVQPLAQPAILGQLPKLLFGKDTAFKIRPSFDCSQLRWLVEFLWACRTQKSQQTTESLLGLAGLSRLYFDEWKKTREHELDFLQMGKLVFYREEKAFESAKKQVDFQQQFGCEQEILSGASCIEMLPPLANLKKDSSGTGEVLGGVYTKTEAAADCFKTCLFLKDDIMDLGGNILLNQEIKDFVFDRSDDASNLRNIRAVKTQNQVIEADIFVLANGCWVNHLLAKIGTCVSVYPLKGYSITLPREQLRFFPEVSVTDASKKIVYAPLGDKLRVAGFAEMIGFDQRVDIKRIEQLKNATQETFGLDASCSDVTHHEVDAWAGLRPVTPTGEPIIGCLKNRIGVNNLYVNVGQGALGFTLAFGSAYQLLGKLPKIA